MYTVGRLHMARVKITEACLSRFKDIFREVIPVQDPLLLL